MKMLILIIALFSIVDAGVAQGAPPRSACATNASMELKAVEPVTYLNEGQLSAEILEIKRQYEAEKAREKGRKAQNAILLLLIGAGALIFCAKWISLFGRRQWRVPGALWALLLFIGALYFGTAVYFDIVQGRTGVSSKAGISMISRDREPFYFYVAISLKVALTALLMWASLRKSLSSVK